MAVVARRRTIAQVDHRWNIDLVGAKDGVNTVFTTPEEFLQAGNIVIRLYLNGDRLRLGALNDYTVSESGGPGTGFDTVTLAIPLITKDQLTADYIVNG
jgi:hypothetical protein